MCLVADTNSLTSSCILLFTTYQARILPFDSRRKDESTTFNSWNVLIYDFDGIIYLNTSACKRDIYCVLPLNLHFLIDGTVNLDGIFEIIRHFHQGTCLLWNFLL